MFPAKFELTWKGPYSWINGDNDNVYVQSAASDSGIYMWAVEYGGRYLIYYVGETGKTFSERLRQHEALYWNGTYRTLMRATFRGGPRRCSGRA